MNVRIRLAEKGDLFEYTKLLQKAFQDAYTNEKIGQKKEYFSKKVFSSARIKKHLIKSLVVNDRQKCWLAFVGSKMVGSITVIKRKNEYELRGFYVAADYQGKGIGKKLWDIAREFAKDMDITCDVYEHNIKGIEVYKKWGFIIDKGKGEFYRHWDEWPEGVKAKCIYMRYKIL